MSGPGLGIGPGLGMEPGPGVGGLGSGAGVGGIGSGAGPGGLGSGAGAGGSGSIGGMTMIRYLPRKTGRSTAYGRRMLPPEIAAYYECGDEQDRLTARTGRLEWARTWELLGRFLPPAPATVLDVGGGPGAYAVPLALAGSGLTTGVHRNPTGASRFFTTAHFARPDELAAEVTAAGFTAVSVLAVEGPGTLAPDVEEWMDDPRRREWLLRQVRRIETETSLLGASPHLLAVARAEGD